MRGHKIVGQALLPAGQTGVSAPPAMRWLLVAATAFGLGVVGAGEVRSADPKSELPGGANARFGELLFRIPGVGRGPVIFSPDGKLIAAPGRKLIKIWNAATGELVREFKGFGFIGLIESIAFSPDGKLLACGCDDRNIRLWNVQTGADVYRLKGYQSGMAGAIYPAHVAFAPDGKTLYSAGIDAVIQIWDLTKGELVRNLPNRHVVDRNEWVMCLAVSPDGKTLATGYKKVRLYDLSGQQPPRVLPATTNTVHHVQFSSDGKLLAWKGWFDDKREEEVVELWDWQAGERRVRLDKKKEEGVTAIAFAPDGKRFGVASWPNTSIWDAATGKKLLTVQGATGMPWSVAWSPDGSKIASASDDNRVHVWDAATGKALFPSAEGHSEGPSYIRFSPDGAKLQTLDLTTLLEWDVTSRTLLRKTHVVKSKGRADCAAFSPSAHRIAAGHNVTVELTDASNGNQLWSKINKKEPQKEFKFQRPGVQHLIFSNDGKVLADKVEDLSDSHRSRAIIRVQDTASGEMTGFLQRPNRVHGMLLSDDGKTLVLHEQQTTKIGKKLPDEKDRSGASFDPVTGEFARYEYAIRFLDMKSGQVLREIKHPDLFANAFARSPDGKWFTTGTSQNRVTFWDAARGKPAFTIQGERKSAVIDLMAFSPDGAYLAVASNARFLPSSSFIQIWDVAGRKLIRDIAAGATGLAFSRDGALLAAGQEDGTTLLWRLAQRSASLSIFDF